MSVIITFDDGLRSTYEVAYPIMTSFGIIGVCFVCGYTIETGNWQGKKIMSLSHIKELNNSGWEIGNHSFTHPYSNNISNEELSILARARA